MSSAEDIIEKTGEALKEDKELPFAVNNNPEIHELELERIFAKTWNFIGHESEIPDNGDYVRRYVGTDPVVMTRDDNGELQVFLDICPHRGTTIVQAEEGNTSHFRCPYHGWTFKNTGDLAGVPYQEAYQDEDIEDVELYQPRVDDYKGMIFATFDDDIPTLDDYMGEDFQWYLDLFIDLTEEGYEVLSGPDNVNIDMNWKMGAENFTADWYHFPSTHKSAIDVGLYPGNVPFGASIVCEGEGISHTLTTALTAEGTPMYFGFFLDHGAEMDELLNSDLDEEQKALAKRCAAAVGTFFPNTSFIQVLVNYGDSPKHQKTFMAIHKWRPLGPDRTQLQFWTLGPRDLPEEEKEKIHRAVIMSNSSSAPIATDDFSLWNRITEASGSRYNMEMDLKGHYTLGDGGEVSTFSSEQDLHPRGEVVGHYAAHEGTELEFRKNWYRVMSNGGLEDGE